MTIRKLTPWNRRKKHVPVRRDAAMVDPFSSFSREIDGLFDGIMDDFFCWASPLLEAGGQNDFTPRVDILESDTAFEVRAEVPGVDEKDLEVSLAGDRLTLRGERKEDNEEKRKDYYRRERSHGAFHRMIALPEGIDPDKVEASFKRGVLTVKLPKTEAALNTRRRIPVKAA